ncbi:MAG TPA: GNAT family N-acetyltransferase [Streptosporangiaceae bacterium]
MIDVRAAHTADLDAATLEAVRALLAAAFDDLTSHDWEHALGGVHALAWEGDHLVGHASVIQRRLLADGRALRTGYVEAVAVRADRRGRGYGAAVMEIAERVVRGGYELGALASASRAAGFYAARGWQLWRGPASALTPAGIIRTPDEDGCIYVLPVTVTLDLSSGLTCDWRDGDVW